MHCPKCKKFTSIGFITRYLEAREAIPEQKFLGLWVVRPAQPARAEGMEKTCAWCLYCWVEPV